ncbi:hypothetical protein YPPY14_2066, partial [Yersinia pestis PY-14]
MGIYDLKISIY